MKKRIKTTRKKIVEYWSKYVYEGDLGTDWDEAENRCWRCGVERKNGNLDRCHIIPEQTPFNGKDEPSNFVLLCKRCHKEAPDVPDPNIMFTWIKNTSCNFYDEFDFTLISEAFKKIYGFTLGEYIKSKNVVAPMLNDESSTDKFKEKIHQLCENFPVGLHSLQVSHTSSAYRLHKIIDKMSQSE